MTTTRAARRRKPAHEPLAALLSSLDGAAAKALRRVLIGAREEIPRRVATRGRDYLTRIGVVSADGATQSIVARVEGSDIEPYEVDVGWYLGQRGYVFGQCSCPYGESHGACKHLWAVLEHLVRRVAERMLDANRETGRWRELLARFDQLIDGEPSPDPDGHSAAASETPAPQRITWRLDTRSGSFELTPYEQKLRRNGGYTRGRRMRLERVLAQAEEPDAPRYLRRFAQLIESEFVGGWYGGSMECTLDQLRALQHLVNSDLVFSAEKPDRPVSIERAQAGLRVGLQPEGNVALDVQVGEEALSPDEAIELREGMLAVARDGGRRVQCAELDSRAAEVVRSVCDMRASFPVAARDALLQRLAGLRQVLPLTVSPELRGEPVPADPTPRLRLTPAAGGSVRAALRVVPHDGAPALQPGEPGGSNCAVVDGRLVELERGLDIEREHAGAVARALGLAEVEPRAPFTWELEDPDTALELLARAQALEEGGLRVDWCADTQRPKVAGTLSSTELRVQIRSRRDWFGVTGGVEIDGARVALAQLMAALRAGRRYVEVSGGRFVEIAEELAARLRLIDGAAHTTRGELSVGRTAGPVIEEALAGAAALEVAPAWKIQQRRMAAAQEAATDPPEDLRAELRPYQREGVAWLRRLAAWGVGSCLADDMGLGKTVQALAALLGRTADGPALVVAPTSVGSTWKSEAERFAPSLRARLFRETDRSLEGLGPGDLIITSYDLARIEVERLREIRWGTLVLDEAQRVKNSATKTAKALRSIPADWRLALTGTPVENHLGELWSMFRLLEPGLFGSWESFRERYAAPIERGGDEEAKAALAQAIRPFVLRRTKAAVLTDLPPRTDIVVPVEPGAEERERYEQERVLALASLERLPGVESGAGGQHRFHVLAAITRLRQLACHPRLIDPDWSDGAAKLAALIELVTELREEGHRALVFSQFTRHLRIAREALEASGAQCLYLDGSTPARERTRRVERFQGGEGDAFLISIKAGGTGLNLTGADHVIHLDPWWNPAVEDQASDRAHRIGQTRPVTVFRLVSTGTIEEEILRLHEQKRDLVDGLLAGADAAARLSTDELIALVRTDGGDGGGFVSRPAGVQPLRRGPAAGSRRSPAPATQAAPDTTNDDSVHGMWLHCERLRLGLTQQQLGLLFGVSQAMVCRWERGQRLMRPAEVALLHRLAALTREQVRERRGLTSPN